MKIKVKLTLMSLYMINCTFYDFIKLYFTRLNKIKFFFQLNIRYYNLRTKYA